MVIKGMATWLSWTEAEVSTQETGIWPQATSMWSLYPVQVSLSPLLFFLQPTSQAVGRSASIWPRFCVTCRSRRVGSGFGRCSSLRGRPRLRGGGGLSGAGGSSLPSLALFWTGFSRASISVASRAIAPMMRPPSARSISAAWILSGSSPRANSGERPGKRGFGRNLRASLPAEDATQGLVDVEALDQGAGGGNAQDRLGHESSS